MQKAFNAHLLIAVVFDKDIDTKMNMCNGLISVHFFDTRDAWMCHCQQCKKVSEIIRFLAYMIPIPFTLGLSRNRGISERYSHANAHVARMPSLTTDKMQRTDQSQQSNNKCHKKHKQSLSMSMSIQKGVL